MNKPTIHPRTSMFLHTPTPLETRAFSLFQLVLLHGVNQFRASFQQTPILGPWQLLNASIVSCIFFPYRSHQIYLSGTEKILTSRHHPRLTKPVISWLEPNIIIFKKMSYYKARVENHWLWYSVLIICCMSISTGWPRPLT